MFPKGAAVALLTVSMAAAVLPTTLAACPPPPPDDATADASAFAVEVKLNGQDLVSAISLTQAFQQGVGERVHQEQLLEVRVPGSGTPLVMAVVAPSQSRALVTGDPLMAQATAQVEVAYLRVLDDAVRADLVRAHTQAFAEPRSGYTDSIGSVIEGLSIDGQAVHNTAPNTIIPIPELVAGPGSYVIVNGRTDLSRLPSDDDPYYHAELRVRILDIHLTDISLLPGEQALDVVVAQSHVVARSPTPLCDDLIQSVGGNAYIASVWPFGWDGPNYMVGLQEIGPVGGEAGQNLTAGTYHVDENGNDVSFGAAETHIWGKVTPGVDSRTRATSSVADLCVDFGDTPCFVRAQAIATEANAVANPWAAYHWGSTVLVNVTIGDTDVCEWLGLEDVCSPPPNTRMDIDGLHITLNEQWGDAPRDGRTGLSVRAIRIESDFDGHVLISRSYAAAEYWDPPLESTNNAATTTQSERSPQQDDALSTGQPHMDAPWLPVKAPKVPTPGVPMGAVAAATWSATSTAKAAAPQPPMP